jgi:uncharacterized protein
VIAFPAAAVLAGFVTLYLAITSDDGLVVDDYYKRGLEINRLLKRERAAAESELSMSVGFDHESKALLLTFDAKPGFEFPPQLRGLLAHATRQGLDYPLLLKRVGDASYRAENVAPPAGRWYLHVGTTDWRLTKKIVTR